MQGKQQSHETDITKPLVIVFIVLAALLVANILGNFSNTKSSTTTHAADKCYNQPFSYANYSYGGDYCSSLARQCGDGYIVDGLVEKNKNCLACCRAVGEVAKLGTDLCRFKTNDNSAQCVALTSKPAAGRKSTGYSCGYASGRFLILGKCNVATTATTTNTSAAMANALPPGKTATDCGVNHLNCSAIFGDGTVATTYVAGSAVGAVAGRTNLDPDGQTVYSGICAVPSEYATATDEVKAQNLTCFVNVKSKTECAKGIYSYYQSPANNAFTCYISVAGAAQSVVVTDGSQADHTCRLSVRGLSGVQSCKDVADQQ